MVPYGTVPTDESMEQLRTLGVDEVVFDVASGTREEVLPVLDAFARYLTAE